MGTAALVALQSGRARPVSDQHAFGAVFDRDATTWLPDALIALTDTSVSDVGPEVLYSELARHLVALVGDVEVNCMVPAVDGGLDLTASSTERSKVLAGHEIETGEGPSWESLRSGRGVSTTFASACTLWPTFAPRATVAGFAVVRTHLLRHHHDLFGVATLLFPVQPPSSEVEIRLSQALVDAATVGIAQRRELDRLTTLIGELEGALDSRVVIEQAKGVVAERAGVSMDLAFTWIRRYARAHNALLVDSARLVIDGRLPVSALRGDSTPC